jgi:cytoskeletal protein CcmA (bactofilin family)
LTLLGKFKGRIEGGEEVVLGEGSESEAAMQAGHVSVHGKMSGSIKAERGIEIYNRAEVEADVVTPSLIIQNGAIFDGKCAMKRQRGRQVREKIVDLKEGWILSE